MSTGWRDYPPLSVENGPWGVPEVVAPAAVSDAPPSPKKPSPRLKLDSVNMVRRQLAIVYREAKRGEIKLEHAKGFCYILDTLSRMLERSNLEDRLEAVERAAQERL